MKFIRIVIRMGDTFRWGTDIEVTPETVAFTLPRKRFQNRFGTESETVRRKPLQNENGSRTKRTVKPFSVFFLER